MWSFLLSGILFVGSLAESKLSYIHKMLGIESDFLVAGSFAVLLLTMKGRSIGLLRNTITSVSRWLSEISYSLYAFHFPLVLLIFGSLYSDKQLVFSRVNVLKYFSFLFLLILMGFVMWLIFERNTPLLRQYFNRKMHALMNLF